STELFEPATADRWLDALTTLLERATADPATRVADLLAGCDVPAPATRDDRSARRDGAPKRFVPSRDELELRVGRVWAEELGTASLGVEDDFFDIGGHSLKAVAIVNRLETELRMTVPVRVLFNARTIAGVCAWIRAHASAAADAALSRSLVPIHVVASAS